jgi:hypothetical protein
MKKLLLVNSLLALALLVGSGCASIVNGTKKKVQITSNPPGAALTVFDDDGVAVATTNTPVILRLKRSDGFFSKSDYRLHFEAPGYYPSDVPLNGKLSGWYAGNIVLGGLIGLIIIDPATGGMWTLNKEVNRNLIATSANLTPEQLKVAELEANPLPKKKPAADPKTGTGTAKP